MYYCQCFVSELEGKDNFDEFDQMLSDQLGKALSCVVSNKLSTVLL